MALHLLAYAHLPPRLRVSHEVLAEEVELNRRGGTRAWGEALEVRCAAARIPFVRWHPKLRLPTRPIPKFVTKEDEFRGRMRRG
jgi:hypothetical protein